MTAEQVAAFSAGVGGYFTPGELLFVIAAIVQTLILSWLAWLAVVGYAGVGRGTLSFGALGALLLRGTFVLALLGYFVR